MPKTIHPRITVDFLKNRVRIHKNTLHMLDDPEFIRLLVNPQDGLIAVQVCNNDDPCFHRVPPGIFRSRNCFEIHSEQLMDKLFRCTAWKHDGVYNLQAKACLDESMIVFRIDEAVCINAEEREHSDEPHIVM